jgi:hypothetical protein
MTMNQIDPRTHYIHEPFDCEALERANRPCTIHPNHFINGLVVSVIVIAIGAALWAADKAMGVPA